MALTGKPKVLMIAFGHPDNVLSLSKAISEIIDFNLVFFVSGDIYEEGVLSLNVKDLDFGLNSYEKSYEILPSNLKEFLGKGFKIRFFRSFDRKILRDKKLRNFNIILCGIKILKRENYDIIHFNGISGFMIYFLLFFRKPKRVWTLHDYIPHTGEENNRSFSFQKLLMRFGFHYIQHYKYLRDQLINYYNLPQEKVSYIPSGPLDVFKSFKPEYPIDTNEKYILFFGRISKYKGIEYLISAFNQISHIFPDIKLIIAGRGNLMFHLEENENIIFINRYIKTSELVGLIQNSLFIVVPYTDSTHSAVVATSYTFLKPVIASKVGGLPEIVRDGETGFLVKPKNVNELAEKMQKMLSDSELISKFSNNIYALILGEYSWKRINEKMINLYYSLIEYR